MFWVWIHHWGPERISRRGASSPATVAVAAAAAAAAPDFLVKVAVNLANLGLTPSVADANAEPILLVELLVLIVDVSELWEGVPDGRRYAASLSSSLWLKPKKKSSSDALFVVLLVDDSSDDNPQVSVVGARSCRWWWS